MDKRLRHYCFLLGILIGTIILTTLATPASSAANIPEQAPLNIVFILTDDQRLDSLCWGSTGLSDICSRPRNSHPMPTVETLMAKSVVFENAFASSPLCCPMRASLFSGGFYAHDTNVLRNSLPNGSAVQYVDTVSIATLLQGRGYETGMVGKYLNDYKKLIDPGSGTAYIPPGWDFFNAWYGSSFDWYDNLKFVEGSSTPSTPGLGSAYVVDDNYLTDYMRDQSLAFLDQTSGPFFLMVNFHAPHQPAYPAPRHDNLFSSYIYRDRGFGEQPDGDLSDKPVYVQEFGNLWQAGENDELHRDMLRSLRAVDEAVAAIINQLKQTRQLGNTVFIFASDQGHMWGEHKQDRKGRPYEEDVRTPLIILMPGVQAHIESNLVLTDLDLAATLLDIANVNPIGGEGTSLLPLLANPNIAWRDAFISEYSSGELGFIPSWVSIRTDTFKYVEYASNEQELYDLVLDPYELESKHDDPAYATIMTDLAGQLAQWDRGVSFLTENLADPEGHVLPKAFVGVPYAFQLAAWGGNGVYQWNYFGQNLVQTSADFDFADEDIPELVTQLHDCSTPGWITLQPNGLLTGTPTAAGDWTLCIQVSDTSISPQPGNDRPQTHAVLLTLNVR